jgi:hypothetical protein
MSFQKYIILTVGLVLLTFSGCSTTETPTNSANANAAANANVARANTNDPLATTKKAEEATTNQAETISPVVQAYCDAMRKKDDAALRRVYSQASLKKLEADMKAEKETSLAEYLSTEPVGAKCEVRNEQIQGDRAVAEIRNESYPNGIKYNFVKENGEWKMTTESPEVEAVKQTSNSAVK